MKLISLPKLLRIGMASPNSDTLTSQPWLTNCGRPEDVHTARPQRIGSMPRNNCGRALKDEAKTLSRRSAHRS